MDEKILEKWKDLIEACKAYYIDSIPTGWTDSQFDEMEARAISEDGFYARDYVFDKYTKGARAKNHEIEKIKKTKITGKPMIQALEEFQNTLGKKLYYDLKYDGSSIAGYITDGTPRKTVTVGNLNLNNYGIDQTWKLLKFLPKHFPKGIIAIQMEALIDLDRFSDGEPERARQKANGLINSKYCEDEVENLLTLRVYRYYTDDSPEGLAIRNADYREVLRSFDTVYSPVDGHIVFAPADVFTLDELKTMPGYCETDRTRTSTGYFLNDGWVMYDQSGVCQGAAKYAGAGSETEGKITTTVKSIQWNDQGPKGKDSWSANVIIDPVTIKGAKITKPSAGSVSKLIKNVISPGAKISIVLANSTIPMVGDVIEQGNGDYQWPECGCGHKMSEADIFGSNLKCGNPMCIERIERMRKYVGSLSDIHDLDLNKLLVIDRFKWEDHPVDIDYIINSVVSDSETDYYNYLLGFLTTDLQKRNLDLVWKASYIVLRESYENSKGN